MWINHKTGLFSRLFHSHDKMHLLPFWVFLQSEMIDFHAVSYASTSEIHTHSYTEAWKWYPFVRSLPA